MRSLCLAGLMLTVCAGVAGADTIDFEQYASGTTITNQYTDVTFSGATEVTSAAVAAAQGFSYTPHSGSGFIVDETGGGLTATFAAPQSSVSGWYTAYSGFTLTAYDASGDLLATQTYADNWGTNSMWSVTGEGISEITFSAGAQTLALDDVTYTTAAETPEPGSLLLLSTGMFGGAGICIYRASRAKRAGMYTVA